MGHSAKILADSISPDGVPLTTFEVTFPRCILAEFNTHRMFSRNSASSRAIPVEKMIQRVMEDPYVPSSWGKNQKGMQAGEEVHEQHADQAVRCWYNARDAAVREAQHLLQLGIHKQTTNRLLETFMWHTAIVTATELSNFFHLRNNKDAHPEIQIIARMMQELYESPERKPTPLSHEQWHRPLIQSEDYADCGYTDALLNALSVARCARVSYLTHDGKRNLKADLDLHDRLLESGHLSPFEHVARPMTWNETSPAEARPDECFNGNFRGWIQYRKLIPNEHDILGAR